MKRYTITLAVRASLVVVCLFLTGCAELWMHAYRVKGGYYRHDRPVKKETQRSEAAKD